MPDLIRSERKYFITVVALTCLTFVVALVQNIIKYGIHETYNPWNSVLYLVVSLLAFILITPPFLSISKSLIKTSLSYFKISSIALILLSVCTFYSFSSVLMHIVGFYDGYFSSTYSKYYFGREAFYHVLILAGTTIYVYYSDRKTTKKVLTGSVGLKKITISSDLINWIEADDHYLKMHTDNDALIKRGTLEKLLETLKPDFIRIHRKYLVNKKSIVGTEKDNRTEFVILKSGVKLKIGRSYSPITID